MDVLHAYCTICSNWNCRIISYVIYLHELQNIFGKFVISDLMLILNFLIHTYCAVCNDPRVEGEDGMFAGVDVGIKVGGDSEEGEAIMDGGETDASLSTSLDNILMELCTFSLSSLSSISSSDIFGEQLPP